MNYLSPLEMLYKWEQEKPNEIYLSQPIDGVWHNWTWKEVGEEVRKMAAYLQSLNCQNKLRWVFCLRIVRIG